MDVCEREELQAFTLLLLLLLLLRTVPHAANQLEALVTDVHVHALQHKQVLHLVGSSSVGGQGEADAGLMRAL